MKKQVLFYMPHVVNPSGGIVAILDFVAMLTFKGQQTNDFDVGIIYEPLFKYGNEYVDIMLDWYEHDLSAIKFHPQLPAREDGTLPSSFKSTEGKIVNTSYPELDEDNTTVIVPEGFPNLMKLLAGWKGNKVVLCQSWVYILSSLNGDKWSDYGFNKCICTSKMIKEYVDKLFPEVDTTYIPVHINKNLFYYDENVKQNKIVYSCRRDETETLITKTAIEYFKRTNPGTPYKFMELNHFSRKHYAKHMREAKLALFTDSVAGLGTLPLEALACKTNVVGWEVPGAKEYQDTYTNMYHVDCYDILKLVNCIETAISCYDIENDFSGDVDKILVNYTDNKLLENFKLWKPIINV